MESIKQESNMVEFETNFHIPKDFTGVCVISETLYICNIKDGEFHNETGPAVIRRDGSKAWYINGLQHREGGPAVEYDNGDKHWWYKGGYYGYL